MDGILRCSRYAFGPNRLHLCGPDANREIWDYVNAGFTDFGLQKLLTGFEALYPYLRHIARENRITDPFDPRVVEAYWIGNDLLSHIEKRALYTHLSDALRLKDKLTPTAYRALEERIGLGILPNHNYHVLDVPKKMGHADVIADTPFMDACRISWGTVRAVDGPFITVLYEPLVQHDDQLILGSPVEKRITRSLAADYDIDMLQPGHTITMHWDVPCELIDEKTLAQLRAHTARAVKIANTHFDKR